MRTTLAALAGASAAFASYSPGSYDNAPPASGDEPSSEPSVPATGSSTADASTPTSDFPSCWSSCFKEAGVSAPEDTCGDSDLSACIEESCSEKEADKYKSWLAEECASDSTSSNVVGPTGSISLSHGPSGYPSSASLSGYPHGSDSADVSYPITSSSSVPYSPETAADEPSSTPVSPEQPGEPSNIVTEYTTIYTTVCPVTVVNGQTCTNAAPGGGDGELPTEPTGSHGGVPTEYTSVHPVTKPFTFGDWTSHYTDFETVTLTSYASKPEGGAVPTGYGSGSPEAPTEGSPVGPGASAPAGGHGGHPTTQAQVYETKVPTAYTTVCPATDGDSITTSTISTTSTIQLTFTVTTTDSPESSSSPTGDTEESPYPSPSGSDSASESASASSGSPSGPEDTGSPSSSTPSGPEDTGSPSSSTPAGPEDTGSPSSSTPAGPEDTGSPQPSIPDCWAECFAEAEITSQRDLCGDIDVETCIKAECPNDSYYAYEGWLNDYCGVSSTSSGVVGPTGSSSGVPHPTGSGVPHPTGSGVPNPSGSGVPQPSGTSAPSGTISTSSTCSLPTPTESCKKCDGQPGNDKFCGFDINTNIYKDGNAPITCETVEYDWEITWGSVSPDGVERQAILINGQSPGPKIEANWGDEIIVRVTNGLPADMLNGTTIHWHGIHQKGTPEYDGVPSITQCPIAPGETFIYKFRATQYGSSWYHSHFALQAYDGLFGPLIIHGPVQEGYEYDDEAFISLQDWRHSPLTEIYHTLELVSNGQRSSPTLDNGLINGKNTFNGGGERWSMTVTKGKTYRLRVLNAAIQSTFKFYIDGHSFKVIAADFVPIEPYETNIININNGQRYDVIFTADQPSGNYWMRSDNQAPCSNITNGNDIKAIVHYDDAPEGEPTSTAYTYTPECVDEKMSNLVPIVPWNAGASSDEIDKDILIQPNGGNPNLFKWTLSGTAFFSQWNDPTLQSIYEDGTVPTYSGDLAIREDNMGEWIYVIVDSVIPLPHPIHLHGHDFLVLGQGVGPYNPATAQLQLNNPPRRDTAIMPFQLGPGAVGGWLAVAFYTDNPGVWLMHCHIGWHNAMGFALQIIEGLEDIKDTVEFECQLNDTCEAWHAYAIEYGIEVTDSGV